jgi:hypothetical protein
LDGTRNNEECRNFKTIATGENKNKQGEAYIPPATKLPMSFIVARSIGNHTSMRLLLDQFTVEPVNNHRACLPYKRTGHGQLL